MPTQHTAALASFLVFFGLGILLLIFWLPLVAVLGQGYKWDKKITI
jgi:hypothetical protein